MKWLYFFAALLGSSQVQAAAVFAHFMVGNTEYFTQSDWETNMRTAMDYHIDAFALNMAHNWADNAKQVSLAFAAADSVGFKLFYSFDYAGGGPWPKADVIQFIQNHASGGSYYHYNGQPFVSTFEGPDSSGDWVDIKAQTGCFLVPDWSSIGAGPALAKGVADGLFSWAAWRWGDWRMNTYTDAAYNTSLAGLPYMMPVSPWFYTNLPGFQKNWLWSSDDLWFDRWQEVWSFQPEWVEIITWNDFGESHYIGPLDEKQYDLFNDSNGKAPFNFVEGMPHDAWGLSLPYLIDTYKNGVGTISSEHLYVWHRLSPATACPNDFTKGNTASQLQIEFLPWDIVEDKVFFSALLVGEAYYTVTIGGKAAVSESLDWTSMPHTGTGGLYHGSASFNGLTGAVQVCLYREELGTVLCVDGGTIDTHCSNTAGYTNWNAFTAFKAGEDAGDESTLKLSDQKCIEGFGTNDFNTICVFGRFCQSRFTLHRHIEANESKGIALPQLALALRWEYLQRFRKSLDLLATLRMGFCGFANNTVCVDSPTSLYVPTVSPFNPPACTGGSGEGDFADLCQWSCQYGYCPISSCTCHTQGDLVVPPPQVGNINATFVPITGILAYDQLCVFTCSRGHCPDVCASNLACTSGSGDGNFGGLCGYSCGYNFCPEPCKCLSHGTKVSPPSAIPGVTGFGNLGLDSTTYDPLCNFTCSHGYCPGGACSYEESASDTSLVFTSEDDLLPFESDTTYSAGDGLLFDSSADPDLAFNLNLVGAPVSWEDIDCSSVASSETAPFSDGDTLGCVDAAVSFLFYSIYQDDSSGQVSTSRIRSLSNYHFQAHSKWKPVDNCTIHCMLASSSPSNTWMPVGNGTFNGIYHELHFMHTDKAFGHKVYQGISPNVSTFASRSIGSSSTLQARGLIEVTDWRPKPLDEELLDSIAQYGASAVAQDMGHAVSDTVADTHYGAMCFTIYRGGEAISTHSLNITQGQSTDDSELGGQGALEDCQKFQNNQALGSVTMKCNYDLIAIDPTLEEDADEPDDADDDYIWPTLSPRGDTGPAIKYKIKNVENPRQTTPFISATYTNGEGGTNLRAARGDNLAYGFASAECDIASIINQALLENIIAESEHLIERQLIAKFLEFAQYPHIDLEDGKGIQTVPGLLNCSFDVIQEYMNKPYNTWVSLGSPGQSSNGNSLFGRLAQALGSKTNPSVMPNCDKAINRMKARIVDTTLQPSSDANTIYNTNVPHSKCPDIVELWDQFINFWAQRMENVFLSYSLGRIVQMRTSWQDRLDNLPSGDAALVAIGEAMLAKIESLGDQLDASVYYNRAPFEPPSGNPDS
ncbi:mutanase protein [Rutstroemia sp. NJR-2017a WRK4]|nr:mutanase protein [Rutstroemia sp. NJR-2017a WRK4]